MEEMNKEVVVVIVQNARLTDIAFSMQARARSIRGRVAQYGRCALCLTSGTVTRTVCALAFFFIPPLSLSLSYLAMAEMNKVVVLAPRTANRTSCCLQ